MKKSKSEIYGNNKFTQKDVIQRFNEMHNNVYDYSKVKYVSRAEKVIIICPTHGEFLQTPYGHWRKDGYGCIICAREGNKR